MRAQDTRPLYFISDLHLNPEMPETLAALEHFIEITAADARAVYILGDLFDYWIGDEMLAIPFVQHVTMRLRTLDERGIALYVIVGNRDFLLGARFAEAARAHLLEAPAVIEAFSHRLVLTHGDALCTADRGYQRFKRFVRCPVVQCFFLRWPIRMRLALAAWMRTLSQKKKQERLYTGVRGDVSLEAVMRLLAQSGASIMVHGHTHRPERHPHGAAVRWVLSDWDFEHSPIRGAYLRLDASGMRSISLKSEV